MATQARKTRLLRFWNGNLLSNYFAISWYYKALRDAIYRHVPHWVGSLQIATVDRKFPSLPRSYKTVLQSHAVASRLEKKYISIGLVCC